MSVQRGPDGRVLKGSKLNPGGKVRDALALAEIIRRRRDPNEVMDLLDEYLADESIPIEKKLERLLPWYDRGYVSAPKLFGIEVRGTLDVEAKQVDWSLVGEETRARLRSVMAEAIAALPPMEEGEEPIADAEIIEEENDG